MDFYRLQYFRVVFLLLASTFIVQLEGLRVCVCVRVVMAAAYESPTTTERYRGRSARMCVCVHAFILFIRMQWCYILNAKRNRTDTHTDTRTHSTRAAARRSIRKPSE